MWQVYILQSQSSGRFYIGHTADLVRRLQEHNEGQTVSTRNRGPWQLVHKEPFETKSAAYAREREIKSWKSAARIRDLIDQR